MHINNFRFDLFMQYRSKLLWTIVNGGGRSFHLKAIVKGDKVPLVGSTGVV